MLHAAILAADTPPESSYTGLLISGAVTLMVAMIGYLAQRAVKKRDATTTAPPAENEPQWLKDLRGENRRLRRENDDHEKTIKKHERTLFLAGIDPDTGRRLNEQGGSGPAPHPSPTPHQ